jgi:predicted transglutaminase-like cysteine proteinase
VNREVRSRNIGMFYRWTGMLSRFSTEAHTLDPVCGPPPHTACKLKEWKDFLETVRDEPLLDKLKDVNRFMNKYPYVDDIVNWGYVNHWETPYEFQRVSGNCKDYAIAKFMSLRALGVPNSKMRITVLRDLNLGGIIHAVLVVSEGEKSYILDNQIKQVVTTDEVYHYEPIYSINEEYWWQHFMIK